MKSPTGQPIDTAYWHWGNEWWWQDPQQSTLDLCPYGKVGDRLWVRETWATIGAAAGMKISEMNYVWRDMLVYKADCDKPIYYDWRPSIFMPRWASRITLKVTGVRVERLQEISEADILAEGTPEPLPPPNGWNDHYKWRGAFKTLWDSINLKRGFGWDSNPWVWVLNFNFNVC